MTEKFKQAVETFVDCNEKISRTAEAAKNSKFPWTIEKLKTAQIACEKLAKQRDAAKEIILSAKGEIESDEEEKWFMDKINPYLVHK